MTTPGTLGNLLAAASARWPNDAFVATPERNRTFEEMFADARALAGRLRAQGVGPGDQVGIFIPNTVEAVATLLGTVLLDAIPVVLNNRYRSDELPYVVEHSDMVGLITYATDSGLDFVERIREAIPSIEAMTADAPFDLEDFPRLRFVAAFGSSSEPWVKSWALEPGVGPASPLGVEDLPSSDAERIAVMLYTSGTTARPKGCEISHRAMLFSGRASASRMRFDVEDVVWNPAPLCHVSAYVILASSLLTGCTYLTSTHFDAPTVYDILQREQVTVSFANFPAFYLALGELIAERQQPLSSLRLLTTAAAPAEVETIRAMFAPAHQVSVTGSTELSGTLCINDMDDSPAQRAEFAGRPLDGAVVTLRDPETLEVVAAGEPGEMWVSGPCLFSRYYKDDTSPFTERDGRSWYRTGDLFMQDDGGRLGFRGRLKDMLKVGGENVSAAEIENYLASHPAILTAQVVAIPDARLGEVPFAFVELASGADVTEAEIIEFCQGSVARYKIPRAVRFVTEWPMSATKVQKHVLRARAADEVAAGV
jgi:fatty-acyl-CoA synthase